MKIHICVFKKYTPFSCKVYEGCLLTDLHLTKAFLLIFCVFDMGDPSLKLLLFLH